MFSESSRTTVPLFRQLLFDMFTIICLHTVSNLLTTNAILLILFFRPAMAPARQYTNHPDPMDLWLETQGYYRKSTARDGSCLFRAMAEQVSFRHLKLSIPKIRIFIDFFCLDLLYSDIS